MFLVASLHGDARDVLLSQVGAAAAATPGPWPPAAAWRALRAGPVSSPAQFCAWLCLACCRLFSVRLNHHHHHPAFPWAQGVQRCTGGCEVLFKGKRCYSCHANELRNLRHHSRVSYACDMGNAM